MTCGKGGLHCVCGIHSSDERFTRSEATHCIVAFEGYQFTIKTMRVDCANCGYVSVTAEVVNPYDPETVKET